MMMKNWEKIFSGKEPVGKNSLTSSTSPWLRRAACGEPAVADYERLDDEEWEHRGIIHDISNSSSDEHEFVLGHLFS